MKRPWIEVLEPDRAQGPLKDVYTRTIGSRGALAEVHKIHSLNPESLDAHMILYKTLLYGRSPLHRREREMIAVAVSRSNGCEYCTTHHREAMARYEKDTAVLDACEGGEWSKLSERDEAICAYVEKLTLSPSSMREEDVAALREAGLSDVEILDAAQIAAYFNFVNRLVLGLGVPLESPSGRSGFKY